MALDESSIPDLHFGALGAGDLRSRRREERVQDAWAVHPLEWIFLWHSSHTQVTSNGFE